MKKHSKILSLALALAILLTLALPMTVNAAPTTGLTGSITIEPPASGLLDLSPANFKAYKLFDLTAINAPSFPYTPYKPGVDPSTVGASAHFVYAPASWLAGFLTWMSPKYPTDVELFRAALQDKAFDDAFMLGLAKDLYLYEKTTAGAAAMAGSIIPSVMDNKNLKFNDVPYGYYLVVGTAYRNDRVPPYTAPLDALDAIVTRSMLVNVPEEVVRESDGKVTALNKDAKRVLKADAPTLDKVVNDEDDGWGTKATKDIGELIDYKITVTIPNEYSMKGYDLNTYVFKIHDYMTAGLSLEKAGAAFGQGDIRAFTVNGAPIASTDYSVTYITSPKEGFIIQILPKAFAEKRVLPGAIIVLEYQARLNKDAVIDGDGNENGAYLEYSNNPYADGTGTTPTKVTKVYSFDIHVKKIDGEDGETPLAGAKFKLYRGNDTGAVGAAIGFVKDNRVTAQGDNQYRLPQKGEAVTDTEVVTTASGTLRFFGLNRGIYWLEETEAPIGYNKLVNMIKIEILKDGRVRFYNDDQDLAAGSKGWVGRDLTACDDYDIEVRNHTGGILPGTGGIGTYIFFGTGAILAILMAAAFVIYRRKKTLGVLKG